MADRVDVHSSRLNAEAPEFVPSRGSQNQRHHHPMAVFQSDDSSLKLLNQVEYYFSDLNLATTDHLMRFIAKDPIGFVPISVVASFKKIKALISTHAQLATILRGSSKLVVSDDGKLVRRVNPITDSDIEDLQSRIIVAENLPEDHCHQNLMKIFSAVGSVKNIRTCVPQSPNGAPRSAKSDNMHLSNKLHAYVEYETVELAEKAVTELNEEANWRSGLRVRLMLVKRAVAAPAPAPSKPRGRNHKGQDGEAICEEDHACGADHPSNAGKQIDQQCDYEHTVEDHGNDKEKRRNRGRGKPRGGRPHHNHNQNQNQNHPPSSSSSSSSLNNEAAKHPPGPRMPDGTRGFALGRGKPIVPHTHY